MHKSLLEGYKINGAVWLLVARAPRGGYAGEEFYFSQHTTLHKGRFYSDYVIFLQ